VPKKSHVHDLLESNPLGRIISRLSRSKDEAEGIGRLRINAEQTEAGLTGLGICGPALLPDSCEITGDVHQLL